MRFEGQLQKDGKFWLIEVPMLSAYTQGHTKKEAFEMLEDLILGYVDTPGFEISIFRGSDNCFEVGSSDVGQLIALCLRRKRATSGMSLAAVAEKLNLSSRNAYARYESGKSVPTIAKLAELLSVVDPDRELVIGMNRI